jgi:hypothetical protein
LVPLIYPNQKKARNNLLKQKAKLVGVKAGTYDDTFVTGGGVPGRQREANEADSDEDPEFDNLED